MSEATSEARRYETFTLLAVSLTFTTCHMVTKLLRVAINESFPLFVEVVNGQPRGVLVDLLVAAAEQGILAMSFVPVSLDQWQATIAQGRANAFYRSC